MSSGSHLSKELYDLIKSIGETRSKQEEDKIILQEQAKLKEKIGEQNPPIKKQRENLIKAMYIEMLGHDASFSHIQAVNLTRNSSLQLKRLGYLCCSLFLNEDSELLILLIANLQRDLQGGIHEIIIALTALGKLINSTMINALYEPIQKLLTHQTDLVFDYEEKMRRALCDKEPSVMGAALNLYHEACLINPVPHKTQTSSFVLILKQVIEHKLPREFDYHRIPAPWVQIKLLQILAMLGANDIKVSEQIYEILGQALRRSDDTGINIGHSVTYQCVKTIASIYPNQQLLELASSSVSKFLESEKNNLKYLGISALTKIAQVESKYVLQHQRTIVDCLESKDESLKRETLTLICKMTNSSNVQTIVDKLIIFLKSATDPHFKKDLVNKICQISESYSTDQEWFLKTMNKVFEYGAEFIDSNLLNNFLKLISEHFQNEGNDFGTQLLENYIELMQKENQYDTIYKLISWVMGEIGTQLYSQDADKLNNLVELLMTCITNEFEDNSTRSWILAALAKLSSAPSFSMGEELQACLEYYKSSKNVNMYQRSQDFIQMRKYNAALRKSHMVNFDENLSFLDGFVQNAISNGAKPYNSQLSMQAAMGVQNDSSKDLYFDPKAPDTKLHTTSTNPTNKTDDTAIKATSTSNVWDAEKGYTGNQQKPKVSDTVLNKPSSGNAFQNQFSGQTAISSKDFQQTGRPSNDNPSSIQGNPTQNKKPDEDDPKSKEQTKLMNDLFGGIQQQQTVAKPTYGNLAKKPEPVQQQQQSASSAMDDLLDIGSGDSQPQPQQQQSSIFGSNPPPPMFGNKQGGGPPIFGQKPAGGAGGPPIFGKPKQQPIIQQQTYQQPQRHFKNVNITVEQYEELWEQLSQEQNQVIQSNLTDQNQLKISLGQAGISIIEVEDNELICACDNLQNQKVLVYVVQNGLSLDITCKSNNIQDINNVFNHFNRR